MPAFTNYFAYRSAAERYARSRPFFHSIVTDKIKEAIPLAFPVADALDVGCGTGQSTVALRTIADSVIGVDISSDMLSVALPGDNVRYLIAPAEHIPLPDAVFDLVTVSLAFHWLDRPAFFGEARRTLRNNGWLVIYNNAFRGEMAGNPAFGGWLRNILLGEIRPLFPSPKETLLFGGYIWYLQKT
ncbi:MAG: class I SAM-dependent methyltransferase [Fibrella sp.]|nr:class I SAM-dependent methyltransferase [Armatimonadota bacterium]